MEERMKILLNQTTSSEKRLTQSIKHDIHSFQTFKVNNIIEKIDDIQNSVDKLIYENESMKTKLDSTRKAEEEYYELKKKEITELKTQGDGLKKLTSTMSKSCQTKDELSYLESIIKLKLAKSKTAGGQKVKNSGNAVATQRIELLENEKRSTNGKAYYKGFNKRVGYINSDKSGLNSILSFQDIKSSLVWLNYSILGMYSSSNYITKEAITKKKSYALKFTDVNLSYSDVLSLASKYLESNYGQFLPNKNNFFIFSKSKDHLNILTQFGGLTYKGENNYTQNYSFNETGNHQF